MSISVGQVIKVLDLGVATITLCVCVGQVIKAWDLGVATMKVGEISQLICKPEYAYGTAGSPPKIPPNATLVFQVTCLF